MQMATSLDMSMSGSMADQSQSDHAGLDSLNHDQNVICDKYLV